MSEANFGEYFKSLRISKNKTQEDIAKCIGKHKMLISGIENGKNNPPKEDDLKKIAFELDLNKKEYGMLLQIAAFDRGTLPNEIITYIIENNIIFDLIETIKEKQFDRQGIKRIIEFCNRDLK